MTLTVSKTILVETTISAILGNLREFTKTDWYGYAGCEAEKGQPHTFYVGFQDQSVANFVADDNGIGVDFISANGDVLVVLCLELPHQPNRVVLQALYDHFHEQLQYYMERGDLFDYLVKYGFTRT
jgi:hypothetical protein